MKTAYVGKFLSSSYSQKCLLADDISVFFNRQYFFNRPSSHFDICHLDGHEWKEEELLTRFLRETLIVGNVSLIAPKVMHPRNSGSAVTIFWKFFTMKGASRYMKVMFIIFSKKNCLGQSDYFGLKNSASSWLWICGKNFFKNFAQWKGSIGRWKWYY